MKLRVVALVAIFACASSRHLAVIEVAPNSPTILGDRLAEAIGIETLGGVFTPLLEVGCSIPCETTRTFSTAADNQTEISLFLFRGNGELASQNHSLGELAVTGIRAAPRGEPQVAITLRAGSTGIVLSARDLSGAPVQLERRTPNYAPSK